MGKTEVIDFMGFLQSRDNRQGLFNKWDAIIREKRSDLQKCKWEHLVLGTVEPDIGWYFLVDLKLMPRTPATSYSPQTAPGWMLLSHVRGQWRLVEVSEFINDGPSETLTSRESFKPGSILSTP